MLPRAKPKALKVDRNRRIGREQVGGVTEPLPAQEAYGKDEAARQLKEEHQKKWKKSENLAMDWKKAVTRLIEQQKKKELDAQVGLVHGRKYEKPDGTTDVFVEGKRG